MTASVPAFVFDAALPQLSECLDSEHMARIFSDAFEVSCCTCDVTHARYNPGQSCLFGYKLTLNDGNRLLASARIYPRGQSASHFEKAQAHELHSSPLGRAVDHVPELQMVVWVFPNDRKLVHLPRAGGPKAIDELPPRVRGTDWALEAWFTELVRYVPEHACMQRVSLHLRNPRTGELRKSVLFGKTYADQSGQETHRNMERLWKCDARRQGHLRLPRPIFYDSSTTTLWQSGLDGTTLDRCPNREWLPLLDQVGAQLVELHGSKVNATPATPFALREAADVVSLTYRSAVLNSVIDRLESSPPRTGSFATLHGDLHLKNLFFATEGISLIGFDKLCIGNPLRDLGSLVASFYCRWLMQGFADDILVRLSDPMITSYRRLAAWEVHRGALAWHIAASLIADQAYRCVTRLERQRQALIPKLIHLADRISREEFNI